MGTFQPCLITMILRANYVDAVSQAPVRKQASMGKFGLIDILSTAPDAVNSVPKQATSIVREARTKDLSKMTLESADSVPKSPSSIVREAKKSWQVAANGNIEMSHEEIDSKTKLAPSVVREAKKSGKVTADGSVEMSNDLASMPRSPSSVVREVKKRKRNENDARMSTSTSETSAKADDEVLRQDLDVMEVIPGGCSSGDLMDKLDCRGSEPEVYCTPHGKSVGYSFTIDECNSHCLSLPDCVLHQRGLHAGHQGTCWFYSSPDPDGSNGGVDQGWQCGMKKPAFWVTLFTSLGSDRTYENHWSGWTSIGSTVSSGNGKFAAYDSIMIAHVKFEDDSGDYAHYQLSTGYAGRSLLDIASGCMAGQTFNNGSDTWDNGHCQSVGALVDSSANVASSARRRFNIPGPLRIGVGDGSSDRYDWAMFVIPDATRFGDFLGRRVWAFGSELRTNTGYSGQVTIKGLQACDWQCYLDRYPDLQNAYGATNIAAAGTLWHSHGQGEGRECTCPACSSFTTEGACPSSHCGWMDSTCKACDWQCYLDRYPDLQNAYGATNPTAAQSHWIHHGKGEGRDCTCLAATSILGISAKSVDEEDDTNTSSILNRSHAAHPGVDDTAQATQPKT